MRAITKSAEPTSLTTHRHTPHGDYDNYRDKDTLRGALANEQRGLCCYCMGRIRSESMKVEHWRSRSRFPEEQLDYGNLLGACEGGEGQPRSRQHCDTRKGDSDLRWNPANRSHAIEKRICYESDGGIRSADADFDVQLDEVLNLNLPLLKTSRRRIRERVVEWWKMEQGRLRGPVPRERFEKQRARRVGGAGDLEPYCQVAVWWLDRRLRVMSA